MGPRGVYSGFPVSPQAGLDADNTKTTSTFPGWKRRPYGRGIAVVAALTMTANKPVVHEANRDGGEEKSDICRYTARRTRRPRSCASFANA